MAPTYHYWDITPVSLYISHISYCNHGVVSPKQKFAPETKKQRIARIAKERMYASWLKYDDQTIYLKKVIQLCKPQHKSHHLKK